MFPQRNLYLDYSKKRGKSKWIDYVNFVKNKA
ncbi:MAG: hypothetical protein [Bacteriophage sp.]|nr:MAG: hypothetical protein [Bacteriophage sp.]